MQIESPLQSQHHYTTATIILQVDTGIIVTKFQYLFWIFCHMVTPCNSARNLRQDFCLNSKFRRWRNTVCIPHLRNCRSGAKRRLRLADAIVRCCLRNYFHSTRNEFCFHEIMSSSDFFFILSILSAVLRRPTLWIDPKFILEIDI